MGAMTMFFTEAFPSFHFKGDHFITLYLGNDLGFDDSLEVLANG